MRILELAAWLAIFYGVLVVNVVVHELAHAFVAKIVGFRTYAIYAGPLVAWWNPAGKLRLGLSGWTSHLLGGYVSTLPRTVRQLRGRTIAVLLAGPLASLASMGACAVIFAVIADDPRNPTTLETILLLSVGVELVQLYHGGAFRRDLDGNPISDGAQALDLLLRRPAATRGWRANVLLDALIERRRDEEVAALMTELSRVPEDGSIELGQMAASIVELSDGRFELAKSIAVRMQGDPRYRSLRQANLLDLAILFAIDGDDAAARAAIDEAKASEVLAGHDLLPVAEAAVAKEWELAHCRFGEWEAAQRSAPNHQITIASQRWMAQAFERERKPSAAGAAVETLVVGERG